MANTIYTRQNISFIDPNKYGGSNYDITRGLTGTALEGLKAYNQQVSMKNAFDLGKGSSTASSGSSGLFGKGGVGNAAAGALLGVASSIGQSETNKRGLFDVMDPVHQLAGGRESAVGNALGDAGVGVFQAGAQSGNPWIMLAGAGLKVFGGLGNALWGTKEDKEKRAAADRSIGINLNFVSSADYFDDIKGPATLTDTNIFTGGLFSGGKARRLNEEYSLKMANAFNWADRSIGNNVMNLKSNQLGNFLRGYRAYGGPIEIDPSTAIGYSLYTDKFVKDTLKKGSGMTNMFAGTPDMFGFGGGIYTKGANFDTGVSFINKGGTHELNPNEGVQMGVDSQGVPNLVEEGEVKWGDYMFSDRLIVPRGKRGNYGKRVRKYAEGGKLVKGKGIDTPYESKVLKPYEGLTFADAAKKILKRNGADERDDAITMRGVDAQLSILAGVLEKEREKEKLREMQETIDNMSPEEFAMLQQQMEAQQAALQQQEMAMQQLQMIPEGMELMQPVEQQQPIAALGGLLDTDNQFKYGGNLEKFAKDLEGYGLTIDDYLAYYAKSKNVDLKKGSLTVTDETFDKDLAEQFLDRAYIVSKQYARRAKQQGIKKGELKGTAKALYDRDLALAVRKGLSDGEYNVALDDQISFNNSRVTSSSNRQQSYNDLANYNNLLERGGRKVTLDENGRPTWDNIEGLTKIDNSADNFYSNLGILSPEELQTKGVYDYNTKETSTLDNYDNLKLYGWRRGEDGSYAVDKTLVNPNDASKTKGNSKSTYKVSDLGRKEDNDYLSYGDEGYKEALDNILNNAAYTALTEEVLAAIDDVIKNHNGDFSKLPARFLNYLKYLDKNSANEDDKLLVEGEDGKISLNLGNSETGARSAYDLYKDRRNDNKYGIYHYQYGSESTPAASRYFYMDNGVPVYIEKPGEGFIISDSPKTVNVDGTFFNDYEVTGLNKGRTLTQLPTGEVVDVTDLADLPNWKKLDKPVLVDNTDNLGYGIKGTTDWVDYGSSPVGQKVVDDENPFSKPSNWPFGLAAALQLGSLGSNILNPTDYSNADALSKASEEAGNYIPVEFRPLGTHHVYKADDPWFYTSPIIAQGNTTLNAIANKVAPSKDAETLLNSYNIMQALGNAARQQLDHNFDKKFKTTEANNALEKFWSEGFLKADMANQDAASRAARYSLEGKRAAYAMRQAIDDAKANAISAGFSGLANLAYNYGTNRDQTKLLGWLGRSGANGPMDMSKYGRKFEAHGGRIRRKKGLSF